MDAAYSALQKYYGYTSFRPLQEEIIHDVLNRDDVFVLMPTGAGKSLCYQLPAVLLDGLTIVVSPLIALMKDQVDSLKQNGIAAAYLNSSQTREEQAKVRNDIREGKLSLLYVAPERLMLPSFLEFLKSVPISLFAIDEAHCISEWGHDFRQEYRQLAQVKDLFPAVPIIALTATATPRVKQDILKSLGLQEAKQYQASFNRPNLQYFVQRKNKAREQVLTIIKKHSGESGIVYCSSRDKVERMSDYLKQEGIKALPYHAGLSDEARRKNQEAFLRDDIEVIVATIAFGMGIDKPNVRFVIHADLPSNIERYYQETGRAGRDGLPSECVLLFSSGDRANIEYFIAQKSIDEQAIARELLRHMLRFAQTTSCRRKQLLGYFEEVWDQDDCQSCDNCLTPPELFDGTELTQKILSCVFRLHERFGARYVVDILTGSTNKKILQNNHQSLSTYGIVKDVSTKELLGYIQELIERGYLLQAAGQYPTIHLTQKSGAVLKKEETITLHKLSLPDKVQKQSTASDASIDYAVFERLRTLRKQLADKQHLPPYMIFSDVTLKDMAAALPKTKEEFASIKGVGKFKLDKYAEAFLAEILA